MLKRLNSIFKTLKIRSIDTITTKLLLLVLFITIIPMIAVTNFSNSMLNQSLINSAKYELDYNSDLFNKQISQEFDKLLLTADLLTKNCLGSNFYRQKESKIKKELLKISNNTKLDIVLFVNNDKKVFAPEAFLTNYQVNSNLSKLVSLASSGEIIKSSESFNKQEVISPVFNPKREKQTDIYNLVFYPLVSRDNKIHGTLVIGKKMIDFYNYSNQKVSVLIKPVENYNLSNIEKKSKTMIKEIQLKSYLGKTVGHAFITVNSDKFIGPLIQNIQAISIISIISLIVAITIAALFARTITTPILNLVSFARKISEGHMDLKVKIKGSDEIAQLASTFNKMTEDLKTQEQLRDNFVATLTHDLKVPMLAENQTINYFLKEAYGPVTEEQEEVLKLIKSTNNASLEMVSTLLEVYRYDMGNVMLLKSEIDIVNLLKKSIEEISSLAEDKKILIKIEKEENTVISVDEREIKRVIHNLISNAISNGIHRGHILCRVSNYENKEKIYLPKLRPGLYTTLEQPLNLKNMVVITIKDDGVGISREEICELFKRFSFNKGRKPAGSGLGLYYSYQVVKKHNGYIWAESLEGQGCTFKFALPIA